MQSVSRPATATHKSRSGLFIPKVDFDALISSLRPEAYHNPVLKPPQKSMLVRRRPSCLRLRRPGTPSAAKTQRAAPTRFTIAELPLREKTHSLLSYYQSQTLRNARVSELPLSTADRKPTTGLTIPPSENASILIDSHQLQAALGLELQSQGSETTESSLKHQYAQTDLIDDTPISKMETALPSNVYFNSKPPTPHRIRTLKSAVPPKRPLTRTQSHRDQTILSPKNVPVGTRLSVVTNLYLEKTALPRVHGCIPSVRRVRQPPGLRKSKTEVALGSQIEGYSSKRERLDIYFPCDVSYMNSMT